jgi:hypothetical protein
VKAELCSSKIDDARNENVRGAFGLTLLPQFLSYRVGIEIVRQPTHRGTRFTSHFFEFHSGFFSQLFKVSEHGKLKLFWTLLAWISGIKA